MGRLDLMPRVLVAEDETNIRELVRHGLRTTRGSYRGLMNLFGMSPADYQRFHNFLAAHDCKVDYREFRTGGPAPAPTRRVVLPPLSNGVGAPLTRN